MPSLKDRATALVDRVRARSAFVDHAIRTQQHYTTVRGSRQAGAVTYFAFLSFFPLLALAFFVVGYVARIFPDAQANLVTALNTVLPGLIGPGEDQISLEAVQRAAATVGILGALGLLYAGLGWLSAMREALTTVFAEPRADRPGFVVGKVRDVLTLAVIGLTLVISVSISGVVTGFSADFLDLIGIDEGLGWLLAIVGVVVGGAAETVLFFALFKLLARPRLPASALWAGALLGAVLAEAMKYLSSYLIGLTKDQPAFQAFGISLILLVWINYFSRAVMYAACWAAVARTPGVEPLAVATAAAAARSDAGTTGVSAPGRDAPGRAGVSSGVWFGSGAALMLAVVAWARRRRR